MAVVYKVSSTERLQLMERELSSQLSALKTEIEENGVLQGTPAKSYSSVHIPKDMSYFRQERELVLRRALQVVTARPVLAQADAMQRELESCLSREYTPESLPLLLHQFYTDRSYQLAQCKYQYMLRWRRFCRHSSIIEQLYPLYKKQVSRLMGEYEDAVQRSRRLSVSRERVLTGSGNPINAVTPEDIVIYLQWLVCHLHSLKTIHSYLQYAFYWNKFRSEHMELPTHRKRLEEFESQLQQMISHFNIDYNTKDIKNTANEMELFSMVLREFRTVFKMQETMKTFPVYNATDTGTEHWGKKKPSMALKKEATWIPFIRVKPKQDPWQQKQAAKLKKHRSLDELLRMHCRFLQVSDPNRVMDSLKEHAACISDPEPIQPISVTSHPFGQNTYQIWERIYSTSNLFQEPNPEEKSSSTDGRESEKPNLNKRPGSHKKKNENYSYMETMQLLGLDDGQEEGGKDPVMTKGAYLSFLYLRHLRIRELQRTCLGVLNYMRSVERTLAFDTAGLSLDGEKLSSSAEESSWMSAARGGTGSPDRLGNHYWVHSSPADYKVHCAKFMEFPDVENYNDFYSTEDNSIHTQDHRGLYIMYDVALKDLKELENTLLLVASHYIGKDRGRPQSAETDLQYLARVDVDRFEVLLDLWTCEATFLKSKQQLLDCYFEAYQHVMEAGERFAVAQVITDILHQQPRLDLEAEYFVSSYKEELICLQSRQQLIRQILSKQIDEQRQYLQRIWRDGQKGTADEYGLPPNYIPKQLVSINNSCPALKNVFLLEFHPSLSLASEVHQAVSQAYTEMCQLYRPRTVGQSVALEQRLLQQALEKWQALESPGSCYSSQIQKDLFSDVCFEDPFFVRDIGFSVIQTAQEEEKKQGKERQEFVVETFCRLLELVTIRHRLMESASETAQLSQLYKSFAEEMGFGEFHLYLRPVQFEFAVLKEKAEQPPPLFITALLQDDSSVDRYSPSTLLLGIQELDEKQIGKFSFRTEEAVVQLMSTSGIQNLQVTLACQVTQKNVLLSAVKQACFCYWSESRACEDPESQLPVPGLSPARASYRPGEQEAFVSVQLEKLGFRDEMLNTFLKRKQAMGTVMKNPEETEKVKRGLILEFCQKFSLRMSQYSLRSQIVEYYSSLAALLEDIPSIRDSFFVVGQPHERKGERDCERGLISDPRSFQPRPRCLLSVDGKTFLNLWFIPHFSEVLIMFKTLDESACHRALQQTLQIVAAFHDIVHYLVSFARLGNVSAFFRRHTQFTADWGGTEGIGKENRTIQYSIKIIYSDLKYFHLLSRYSIHQF
ncbi:CF183 protein, partial [Atractosteus spatula]|nr:CF183 protein [Atractosteus spatula]